MIVWLKWGEIIVFKMKMKKIFVICQGQGLTFFFFHTFFTYRNFFSLLVIYVTTHTSYRWKYKLSKKKKWKRK